MPRKPNPHAARIESRNRANLEAGLVSARFPSVSGIVLNISYYHRAETPLLMVRTINVYPTSYACFKMDCMVRNCSGGGFDLTGIIDDMVKNRTKKKKGAMDCLGKGELPSAGHASIEYEAVVTYK